MKSDFRDVITCIRAVNRQVAAAADQANGMVDEAHEELERFHRSGYVRDMTLLGPVLRIEGSQPGDLQLDIGRVVRAALKLPGGFGVVCWDLESYHAAEKTPEGAAAHDGQFIAFRECGLAFQALLRPHLEELLQTLYLRME